MATTTQKTNGATAPTLPGVAPATAPPAPPRLKLAFASGIKQHPLWVHLFGFEGVGKTSFAADAPDVVFIDVEHGTYERDVNRFVFDETTGRTTPAGWGEVLDALRLLGTETHPFKTVAIDTLDAVEALIHVFICKRDNKADIEAYGYGKGHVAALDEWRKFVAAIERIRAADINVVTLAHAVVKAFKNPEGDDYDRFVQKMNEKAGGLIKERADVVLFAQYETFIDKNETTKRTRGVSSGARLVRTQRTAAYDAKNRYDLPDMMPLSWSEFHAAVKAYRPADPKALCEEIARKAKDLGDPTRETAALAWAEKYAKDAPQLARMNDLLNGLLAAKPVTSADAQ